MPHQIDPIEIAKTNPKVDLDALERGRQLRKGLQETITKKRKPFTRRRVRIDDGVSSDPRAVRLQK